MKRSSLLSHAGTLLGLAALFLLALSFWQPARFAGCRALGLGIGLVGVVCRRL